ncbi:probable ATP-dependent RNA helicase DHX37 [Artemia franciscana]|uniref:RNA helicase n=1 Tax=Artemia franciscana TaxID=6661 RepID=A0AA88L549_ARTSF|nr:hypothetical protein QYM36_014029 [Artemia franciscana]
MGKLRKRFNQKGRSQAEVQVDNSEANSIAIEENVATGHYDDANLLVLPSTKRKTKIKEQQKGVGKILSKKKRKALQKVIETKKKKENRAGLIAELGKVQISESEAKLLTSITEVQTKGWKRFVDIDVKTEEEGEPKKKKRIKNTIVLEDVIEKPPEKRFDPNIVGLDEETDDSDNVEEEESSENHETYKIPVKDQAVENNKYDAINNIKNDVSGEGEVIQVLGKNEREKAEKKKEDSKKQKPLRKTCFVPVFRTTEIQEAREKLPILAEEQTIMETISENPVVILAGETGSGKTTQVPQFLYEAGYAENGRMIGITEPRRVAAVSMAARVSEEMALGTNIVSYQIRFQGNVTDETKIKFMTDGILLKEIQKDFLLLKYSVVIIDEAHERSVYSDILLGLLSRIVHLRKKKDDPLKLIIMSATLRLEDFSENRKLFKEVPPVIKVESRQYPVTIHFNKRTPESYIEEAYKKICKIHRTLPDGGILVFLTGQQEVNHLCRRLRETFPVVKTTVKQSDKEEVESSLLRKTKKKNLKDISNQLIKEAVNLDNYSALPLAEMEGDDPHYNDDSDMESIHEDELDMGTTSFSSLHVLPLYSMLPPQKQRLVFENPPEGSRLCVVATNVAETSLTIPHIRYVIDTGKVKAKVYDKVTGISAFHVTWTSKASANQRAGRAGRIAPGHCYRLYSSALFNDEFPDFSEPDILRRPIDDLVLQMKSIGIDKVLNFPFPTPPDLEQIKGAERLLINLGALEEQRGRGTLKDRKKFEYAARITALGRVMAELPVAPRYAKMLALSEQHDLLPLAVCLVAALAVPEVLLETPLDGNRGSTKQWQAMRRTWAGKGNSLLLGDAMVLLRAIGAADNSPNIVAFCNEHGLRMKAIKEVQSLRSQLIREISLVLPNNPTLFNLKIDPPTDLQAKLLRQILLAGLIDRVAQKVPASEIKESGDKIKMKTAYKLQDMEDPVFLHPSSVLKYELPEFIIYQEVFEASKLFLRGISGIEPEWLPTFAQKLCSFSDPLVATPPRYADGKILCHRNVTYGRSGWTLPTTELEYPEGLDKTKWFCKFFLDGSIFPKLEKYKASLLSPPETMIKTWARLQPRTQKLLNAVVQGGVSSAQDLRKRWKKNQRFLLSEYSEWLPEALRLEVSKCWPPL